VKLSLSFLRDLVPTPLDAPQAGDLLTMVGFELEEVFEAEGEACLDVNIMANRGDAASVMGLAREFSAKRPEDGETPLFTRLRAGCPRPDEKGEEAGALAKVSIRTPQCSRYAARVFLNVENGPSPEWLQRRLLQSGQRPISLLVDLTNYVMLETGQPLHAFDLDRLSGQEIIVRQANEGEVLTTLDGVERTLNPSHMVIADRDRAVAVAGVMGGADTEVHEGTQRMLLESAHFLSPSIRATRKALGMQTEASWRFERSVDPDGVVPALNRFADLYEQITGKSPTSGVLADGDGLPLRPQVTLSLEKAERLLGWRLRLEDCSEPLRRLGFQVQTTENPPRIAAVPPSWRFDISRPEDLIEEVARIHGYEKFEEKPPIGATPQGGVHGIPFLADSLAQAFLRAGFDEAVSHSLGDAHPLDGSGAKIRVRSPHSPEMAELRSSLLPGLASAVQKNGGRDQAWFECGRVFSSQGESVKAAALICGLLDRPHPHAGAAKAGFLHLKGALESVLSNLGLMDVEWTPVEGDGRTHPTRTAEIRTRGVLIGWMGQIHPDLAKPSGLPADSFICELDVKSLALAQEGLKPTTKPISRYPAALRDIAVLAPKALPYAQISQTIRQAGGANLEDAWLFDIYEGQGVPEGFHSLAIGLRFRKLEASYREEEGNQERDRVVAALEELGVTLRQ
jgi:phenylalanyl-tRNA synthetase beta chain